MELKEYCTDVFKVQFGETDPIDVDRFDQVIYKGKVPGKLIKNVKAALKSFAAVHEKMCDLKIMLCNTLRQKCFVVIFIS